MKTKLQCIAFFIFLCSSLLHAQKMTLGPVVEKKKSENTFLFNAGDQGAIGLSHHYLKPYFNKYTIVPYNPSTLSEKSKIEFPVPSGYEEPAAVTGFPNGTLTYFISHNTSSSNKKESGLFLTIVDLTGKITQQPTLIAKGQSPADKSSFDIVHDKAGSFSIMLLEDRGGVKNPQLANCIVADSKGKVLKQVTHTVAAANEEMTVRSNQWATNDVLWMHTTTTVSGKMRDQIVILSVEGGVSKIDITRSDKAYLSSAAVNNESMGFLMGHYGDLDKAQHVDGIFFISFSIESKSIIQHKFEPVKDLYRLYDDKKKPVEAFGAIHLKLTEQGELLLVSERGMRDFKYKNFGGVNIFNAQDYNPAFEFSVSKWSMGGEMAWHRVVDRYCGSAHYRPMDPYVYIAPDGSICLLYNDIAANASISDKDPAAGYSFEAVSGLLKVNISTEGVISRKLIHEYSAGDHDRVQAYPGSSFYEEGKDRVWFIFESHHADLLLKTPTRLARY